MHHILSRADIAFLGLPRFVHLATCLSDGHSGESASPLSRTVSRADQASVERAQPDITAHSNNPVSLFLQALQELIENGALGVNTLGAQVYVEGDKAAVVVPVAVAQARDRLMAKQIKLPPNTNLYDMLRNARLVEADQTGRSVRPLQTRELAQSPERDRLQQQPHGAPRATEAKPTNSDQGRAGTRGLGLKPLQQ